MRAWLSALCLGLGLITSAQAAETITDFFSDVTVETNGDLMVTESIRVNAEGDEIKRGLLRDFPTIYHRPDGTQVKVGFHVLDVKRDGHAEPYKLETLSNGVRIRMGSADVLLPEGPHEYDITYRTTRQIGFFKDFDELYWNVTGNGWTLPIDHAHARITLPGSTEILRTSVYTGPQGSTDKNAKVTSQGPGQVSFETTQFLGEYEGLTVAAAWPKGVVSPPSFIRILFYWVGDNLATVISLLGFILLAAYYIYIYATTRRRSDQHIVPLYEPPAGLSAPSVRYIARQESDHRTFVVGMLELIALRKMRMDKKLDKTEFVRTDAGDVKDTALSAILTKLFRKDTSFLHDGLEGTRFEDAQSLLDTSLSKQYDPLFNKHRKTASRGTKLWLLYAVLSLAAAWYQDPQNSYFVMMSMPFSIIGIASFTALYGSLRKGTFNVGTFFFALFFGGPFLFGGLALLAAKTQPLVWGALAGLLPLLILPVVIRAYVFLKGYTEEGYKVMDQIAGLKQYLTLAEGPRLQALVTPQEKLDVYERCLPYAVALDVGKAWAAAFSGLFVGVAAMAALDAMQQLYAGHDLLRDDPNHAVNSFSGDVAPFRSESASSSSGSPGSSGSYSSSSDSSSSGSSDSGSSGGGGGGGGGSGW
jgi:hypothetical protein